jgi:hypothetical protein
MLATVAHVFELGVYASTVPSSVVLALVSLPPMTKIRPSAPKAAVMLRRD